MGRSQAEELVKRVVRYDTIALTTIVGSAPTLLSTYRYLVYSRPLDFDYYVHGFHCPFANVDVRLRVSDIDSIDTFTPFFNVSMIVFAGNFQQVEPVLMLPAPYMLQCGHRLQIEVQNNSVTNYGNAYIVIVGSRNTQEC